MDGEKASLERQLTAARAAAERLPIVSGIHSGDGVSAAEVRRIEASLAREHAARLQVEKDFKVHECCATPLAML